jgi:hypothetical protein
MAEASWLQRVQRCLKESQILIEAECLPFIFDEFREGLFRADVECGDTYDVALLFFAALCAPLRAWQEGRYPSLPDVLYQDNHLVTRRRFALLITLILFFRNNRLNFIMRHLWFLLHFRGLTNTGFHILKEFGLGPSIRSLPSMFKSLLPALPACPSFAVWWADNLRRDLKGRQPRPDEQIDWTVVGFSELPHGAHTPYRGHHVATADPLRVELTNHFRELVLLSDQVDLCGPTTHYGSTNRFSVPMRAVDPVKYDFGCLDVLPKACGTLSGTAHMLNYVADNLFTMDRFTVMTLDYDLYWRSFKFYYTDSLIGAFPRQRENLVMILGPWHVFKRICECVWKWAAPLVLARLWLQVYRKPVPAAPELKDIVFFFVAIALTTKGHENWDCATDLGRCFRILIYQLIPLVSGPSDDPNLPLTTLFRPSRSGWRYNTVTFIVTSSSFLWFAFGFECSVPQTTQMHVKCSVSSGWSGWHLATRFCPSLRSTSKPALRNTESQRFIS